MGWLKTLILILFFVAVAGFITSRAFAVIVIWGLVEASKHLEQVTIFLIILIVGLLIYKIFK